MENNIEKVLGIYCLMDKETNVYDSFIYSFDDKEASDFYIENIANIAQELSKNGDVKKYNTLIDRLKNSCIMRLAIFDKANGTFINEQVVLNDYLTEDNIIEVIKSRDNLLNKFKKEE